MNWKKQNPKKAVRLEKKGDLLLIKGKHEKALKKFRKALEFDASRVDLHDKITRALEGIGKPWKLADFIESVGLAMQQQESENPELKHLHAKLSPEFENARHIVFQIISSKDRAESEILTIKLCELGEIGTRAAVDAIYEIKLAAEKMENGGNQSCKL
jgi:tetratricopeptide (TPR) repeat protein